MSIESIAVIEQQPALLIRTSAAPRFIGLPASTFYELAKREDFPKKIVFGRRTTGYLAADLVAWIAAQQGVQR